MIKTVFASASLSAVLIAASPAVAGALIVVPDSALSTYLQGGLSRVPTPTADGTYYSDLAKLVISTKHLPSLLGVAQLATGSGGAGASAEFRYYFVLNGPGSELVPLNAQISAAVQVVNSNGVQGGGGAAIVIGAISNVNVVLATSPGFDYTQSYMGTQSFLAQPGSINFVDLSVSATLTGDGSHFGGFSSAFADPYITIDPAFAAMHPGYSLTFSPGVGNSPAGVVPEPAAGALMLAGLGLLGAALRRGR